MQPPPVAVKVPPTEVFYNGQRVTPADGIKFAVALKLAEKAEKAGKGGGGGVGGGSGETKS